MLLLVLVLLLVFSFVLLPIVILLTPIIHVLALILVLIRIVLAIVLPATPFVIVIIREGLFQAYQLYLDHATLVQITYFAHRHLGEFEMVAMSLRTGISKPHVYPNRKPDLQGFFPPGVVRSCISYLTIHHANKGRGQLIHIQQLLHQVLLPNKELHKFSQGSIFSWLLITRRYNCKGPQRSKYQDKCDSQAVEKSTLIEVRYAPNTRRFWTTHLPQKLKKTAGSSSSLKTLPTLFHRTERTTQYARNKSNSM